jgi:hypothetical protein
MSKFPVNSNREEFSSNRQIFGAEQGLLCFLRVWNGSDAAVVTHQHSSRTTLSIPPINYRTAPARSILMVKRNPRSPATLQREKSHYICDYGAEIPGGSDPSDLAPSFRRDATVGRVCATSVDFKLRPIPSLALPNYSCQPSASLVVPANRP